MKISAVVVALAATALANPLANVEERHSTTTTVAVNNLEQRQAVLESTTTSITPKIKEREASTATATDKNLEARQSPEADPTTDTGANPTGKLKARQFQPATTNRNPTAKLKARQSPEADPTTDTGNNPTGKLKARQFQPATTNRNPTAKLKARQTSSGALPTVTVKGNAFFAGDNRFYVRGVAYQPGGAADAADPLINIPNLKRDVANFKKLGINTIRVYTVDNSASHDEGMKLLADAGIYLALDANTPDFSLNRQNNQTLYQSYNENYLQSIFATIDAFQKYSNLLLIINGNEVINERNNTIAAPYIKALQRDMKAYISARKYRNIPVGYAAADVAENVDQQLAYFDCGPDGVRGDFFALNDYSWCDPNTFTGAGWDKKVERYTGYGVPIFMAEFGCITNRRDWNEVASLYSPNMTSVYSGALAYEYTTEANGYGLVSVTNGNVAPNADFTRLEAAYKKTPNPKGDGGYSATTTASECPPASDDWEVTDDLLPAMPALAQKFMENGAGKGPGLGDDVTPSQYGGESYSAGMVEMDGSAASSNGNGSGTSSGSATSSSAADNVFIPPFMMMLTIPVFVTVGGVLAGMGLVL